jgi:hypothetical protein
MGIPAFMNLIALIFIEYCELTKQPWRYINKFKVPIILMDVKF